MLKTTHPTSFVVICALVQLSAEERVVGFGLYIEV